jgi:hypothetical protein
MGIRRGWVVPLLLYITVDYTDPSLPGAFFLESETLFIEGVVDPAKPAAAVGPVATTGMPVDPQPATDPQPRMPTVRNDAGVIKRALRVHREYKYPPPSSTASLDDH